MTPAHGLDEAAVGQLLKTRWLGRHYLFTTSLGSTNTEVISQACAGAPHGLVVVADSQREGRGRHGRSWASPPGVNLYMSLLLRPDWTVAEAPPVSLAVSVAVAKALACFLPRAPTVKWPNDLLWEGRKLCGVLSEMATEGGRIQHLVVGIGLNVNQWDFDPWIDRVATSMRRICGMTLSRSAVLVELLGQIEAYLELLLLGKTEQVLDEWRGLASWVGGPVSVRSGNREIKGRAVGLTPHGALRVLDDNGREHEVVAGDIALGDDVF